MKRLILAVSVLAAIGAGFPATIPLKANAAAVAASSPALPASVELTWSPAYMSDNNHYTKTQAVALAKQVSLIAALPISFTQWLPAMRAANPKLVVLSYANATVLDADDASGLPNAEFAHDATGKRITSTDFGGYLMEPSNSAWRSYAMRQCSSRVAQSGYDGCLIDMLTMGIYSTNYVSALPVVPGTKTEYTQDQWRTQLVNLADDYMSTDSGMVLAGNTVTNAYRYWQSPVSSRPIAMSIAVPQMENFLRGSSDPATTFPTAADWLQNVRVISDVENAGHTGLFSTKLWSQATHAQVVQWQGYAMASFLMAADGRSLFAFTDSRTQAGATGADLPYSMPTSLGQPTGAMSAAGQVYERTFNGGLAIVNPGTSSARVTLPAGVSFKRLNGSTVAGTLTLPADSGDVLLGGAAAAPTASFAAAGPTISGHAVTIKGTATSSAGLKTVQIAVRNNGSDKWLQSNGTFGDYTRLTATMGSPSGGTSPWSYQISTLPSGSYGTSIIATDVQGTANASPRPWVTFSVH
jgi:hypothetical protein